MSRKGSTMLSMMSKSSSTPIIIAIVLFSLSHNYPIMPEPLQEDEPLFTNSINSSANFTSAGTSTVALSGEPAHVGDQVVASILVSNIGHSTGFATLNINNEEIDQSFSGDSVEITPGSSREVKTSFFPTNHGPISYSWWVSSNGSDVNQSLRGEFIVEVLPKQTISTTINSYDWSATEGLQIEVSLYLSSGSSREVILDVTGSLKETSSLLQSITIDLDPGRRNFNFELGSPNSDTVTVGLNTIGWLPRNDSVNSTSIDVKPPLADPSELSVDVFVTTMEPSAGEPLRLRVNLTNGDDLQAHSGKIRVLRSSDQTILAESLISAVNPGVTISHEIVIPSWPDSDIVQLEVIWMYGALSSSIFHSVESSVQEKGFSPPFDISAALIGVLSGIVIVLSGRLVWRAASSRTPTTSESRIRETRVERDSRSRNIILKEIPCPFCEQRLSVPADHFGDAKCPSCSMQFSVLGKPDSSVQKINVPEENQTTFPKSKSSSDLLECPECDQTLKVPMEKRPVHSRCPVCKIEFLAESG
ncbi:MAG: hypothetical protein QGH38_01040 [Candidatus Thalassarchaeaceae archaeon]|nr:hypothetical protein [Candidatus Thalassarchaeaceae archaeon]